MAVSILAVAATTTSATTTSANPVSTSPSATIADSSAKAALFSEVVGLTNQEITSHLMRLNQCKQALDADLLLFLSVFDQRGLYREQACSSLFTYCVTRLGFSEDVAYKRVGVARMLREFPVIYELLVEGRIHLSALLLLRPLLTQDNQAELLRSACGLSKRAVEQLVAARAPRPDVPTQVRKLPEPKAAPAPDPVGVNVTQKPETEPPSLVPRSSSLAQVAPSKLEPLSSRSYRVVFTASDTFKRKLDRARQLSSHAVAGADLPALIERALDLLIEREEKRRFAVTSREAQQAPGRVEARRTKSEVSEQAPGRVRDCNQSASKSDAPLAVKRSRYVPAAVRRRVWERDEGCCAFVDGEGRRCGERQYLQLEHKHPVALSGLPTVENCELLCAAHNALRAEEVFGRTKVKDAIAEAQRKQGKHG